MIFRRAHWKNVICSLRQFLIFANFQILSWTFDFLVMGQNTVFFSPWKLQGWKMSCIKFNQLLVVFLPWFPYFLSSNSRVRQEVSFSSQLKRVKKWCRYAAFMKTLEWSCGELTFGLSVIIRNTGSVWRSAGQVLCRQLCVVTILIARLVLLGWNSLIQESPSCQPTNILEFNGGVRHCKVGRIK